MDDESYMDESQPVDDLAGIDEAQLAEESPEASEAFGGQTDAAETAATEASGAAAASRAAQQSVREGLAAFKDVRKASQLHSSARGTLQSMRQQLDAHTKELKHRIDIEERYPQIVAEQTGIIEEADETIQRLDERSRELAQQKADTEASLQTMKAQHEEQLRPYRAVAESTRGRADDTARSLADARRTIKTVEMAYNEATKRRDQRIAAANRSVDNAQERLGTAQANLTEAEANEDFPPEALQRLKDELSLETAHLEIARNEVTTVTDEARRDVEEAQKRLFDQRNYLAQVERDADAAKREATERRGEYDSLLKKAQDQERGLTQTIDDLSKSIAQANKEREEALARKQAAEAALQEAEGIHATPQQTIDLRNLLLQEQADLDEQQLTVDELAANERTLRKGTFKQRLTLVLALVGIVVVLIALIAGIMAVRSRASKQEAKPAPVEATQSEESPATESTSEPPSEADDATAVQGQTPAEAAPADDAEAQGTTSSDDSATVTTQTVTSTNDDTVTTSPATPTGQDTTTTTSPEAPAPSSGDDARWKRQLFY